MHEPDLKLIDDAGEFVSGHKRLKISGGRAEAMESAVADYRIACRLARGPDEKRALIWSIEAERRRNILTRLLKGAAKAAG